MCGNRTGTEMTSGPGRTVVRAIGNASTRSAPGRTTSVRTEAGVAAMICASCGAAATARYSHGDQTVEVCARCLDRLELQDAFEARLLDLHALSTDGQYSAALQLLDELVDAHQARDHDRWLARSVLAHRAILLEQL